MGLKKIKMVVYYLVIIGVFIVLYKYVINAKSDGLNIKILSNVKTDTLRGFLEKVKYRNYHRQYKTVNLPSTNQRDKFENMSQTLNYNVHVFYYAWYGNPQYDGRYIHWNHKRLAHWNRMKASHWPQHVHVPANDIASSFYPYLGAYSSRDETVLVDHMQQIVQAGIGVIVLSWYPKDISDDNGEPVDDIVLPIMDAAQRYNIKVTFHIEPYKGRNASNLRTNLIYIIETYGQHPAFYLKQENTQLLPVFYIYDSYITPAYEWQMLFTKNGPISIRGTKYDGLYIGLLVEEKHQKDILQSGFDGFYTYFATNGFTFGSTQSNWPALSQFASRNRLLFVPSIGTGYVDTEVRPWNGENSRDRRGGAYYESSFKAAMQTTISPPFISITSFNEWHEGTQIEKAVPKFRSAGSAYLNYLPNQPDFYLKLTKKFLDKFYYN